MKNYLLLFCICLSFLSKAQISTSSMWTWMKGDNTTNVFGIYGTPGIPSPNNKPGSRAGSVSWTDASDNFWLFGGQGYAAGGFSGYLNDLWRYNSSTNEWTWIKGDNSINLVGIYGPQGVPSAGYKPGSRSGSVSWIDVSGNLWLFGGQGYAAGGSSGYLNDLWKYNPSTKEWTWMQGNNTTNVFGVYGTQGVPSPTNKPGSRSGSVSWTDASGNFWLFGGHGYAITGTAEELNDLWRFNPLTNQWTWMKGDNVTNVIGLYGTPGVFSPNNKPGCRWESVSWIDAGGNLWLFGGYDSRSTAPHYLSDLWKYNPASNQWAFMKGDTITNVTGVYGTQGVPSASNKPGSRYGSISWTDGLGSLWLFGGYNYTNDLWKYTPGNNQWTWMKGDNTFNSYGVYGIKETPGISNEPGARYLSTPWIDSTGNFWLFGGAGFAASGTVGSLNDLWKLSNVYIFTGVFNSDWSEPRNWVNSFVPPNTLAAGVQVTINPANGLCTSNSLLTIEQGAIVTIATGKVLNPQGGLSNEGTINGGGSISLSGSNPVLNGNVPLPIAVNAAQVQLTGHTTTNSIQLNHGGKIKLNNFNLNMGSANLTGYTASNFIITNGTGRLTRSVPLSTSSVIFPVGDASYAPVVIKKTANRNLPGNKTTADEEFAVAVESGVTVGGNIVTQGVVNHTWFVGRPPSSTSTFNIEATWSAADELPGFDRLKSHISLVCPPPDNCVAGFDVIAPSAASGSGPFTLSRVGPFQSSASSFIIRTAPVKFEFTGIANTEWSNAANWIDGLIAPTTIINGVEVFINNNCNYTGPITLQGGKLTVRPGKKLNVAL